MREMISEATRTIEDSQTATALHGLLSLKSESGPSNFPALLKAVGQQMLPQSTLAGGAGEVQVVQATEGGHMEASEVPQAVATVVVGGEASSSQSMALPQGSVAYKPKAGSVMDLLLQMQSQAQRGNAANTTSSAVSSEASPHSNITTYVSLANTVNSMQPTQAVQTVSSTGAKVAQVQPTTRQLGIASPTLQPAGVQMIQAMPRIQAQALTQLIQAQVPQQPVQCRPSQLTPTSQQTFQTTVSGAGGQAGLTTLYQGAKAVQVPIQFITTPTGAQTIQIVQAEKPGELSLAPMAAAQSAQPLLLHPSFVMATASNTLTTSTIGSSLPRGATVMVRAPSTTTTTTTEDLQQQSHNKSPLKKRPYPFSSAEATITTNTPTSQPQVVFSPTQAKVLRNDMPQFILQGGQIVQAAPSGTTGGAGDASQPKTVTVVVQQVEGTQQPITISPHLVDAAVASAPNSMVQPSTNSFLTNNKHTELTAVLAPIMKGEDETDAVRFEQQQQIQQQQQQQQQQYIQQQQQQQQQQQEVHQQQLQPQLQTQQVQQQDSVVNMTAMAVSISEGFDDIFRYTRNQAEQMRSEESSLQVNNVAHKNGTEAGDQVRI